MRNKSLLISYKDIEVKEDGTIVGKLGRPLKHQRTFSGYHYVTIYDRKIGKNKHRSVHRLVAAEYVPNPLNRPCVNHKDGNKENNHFSNLEWCNHKENTKHAYETGLMDNVVKASKRMNLRDAMIKTLHESKKYNQTQMAIVFETTPENISRILK